jgi:heat shock protein HslJ
MIRAWLAGGVLVYLLAGAVQCAPARETPRSGGEVARPDPADLGGTSWRLVEFQGGDDTILRPDDPTKYTIAFEPDGRLHARVDCNRGIGTWQSPGPPQLEFGPLALTRAKCAPGSLHDRIVGHWPYVRSYVIQEGHLFLSLMADGGIYEFEPASAEKPVGGATEPLEGTHWKLIRVGAEAVDAVSPRSAPHLILDPATRRVSGSGGCNRIAGSYELSGARLSLHEMAGTMMACAEGMETESAFLNALERVRGWRITGRELDLLDASGSVIARFEAGR